MWCTQQRMQGFSIKEIMQANHQHPVTTDTDHRSPLPFPPPLHQYADHADSLPDIHHASAMEPHGQTEELEDEVGHSLILILKFKMN